MIGLAKERLLKNSDSYVHAGTSTSEPDPALLVRQIRQLTSLDLDTLTSTTAFADLMSD